jgi:hypothetical protein
MSWCLAARRRQPGCCREFSRRFRPDASDLAAPALRLPSMLALDSILGLTKTIAYIVLVIVMATLSGSLFGLLNT